MDLMMKANKEMNLVKTNQEMSKQEFILPFLKGIFLLGEIENWWDPETETNYHENAKCMIQQYGNYTAKQVNMTLDGVNNQGENIADNGGVKEAYFGYCKYDSMHFLFVVM